MTIKAETLTITDVPVGFTLTTLPTEIDDPDVLKASFVVEGGPIRITFNGANPSSTVGMLFQVGDVVTIEGETNVKNFKAIRATSTSASVYVTYFK